LDSGAKISKMNPIVLMVFPQFWLSKRNPKTSIDKIDKE